MNGPAATPGPPLPATTRGRFVIAASGDLIGPKRPVSALAHPGTGAVFAHFRDADVGFANHEGSAFDLASFAGGPAAENGGGYPLSDPAATADLRALGVSMVSCANNHATDWGLDGMLATSATLDAAGIAHAGTGVNLAAAQRPAFVETDHGRVGLISLASTFTPMSRAGYGGGAFAARPGLFAYRISPVTLVGDDEFATLRRVVERQSGSDGWLGSRSWQEGDTLRIGEERFRRAAAPGLAYEVHARDHADVLNAVRYAKQVSDFVVVAVHAHESATGSDDDRTPPAFLVDLYHAAVDAGADMAVTTGPHVLKGVEVYRGKPLFYGLASLFLEMETGYGLEPDSVRAAPREVAEKTPGEMIHGVYALPDEWYDGVVAVTAFEGGQLADLRLHPLRLTRRKGFRVMGRPEPAVGVDAHRIMHRLAVESAGLGVDLVIDGDTAHVRL